MFRSAPPARVLFSGLSTPSLRTFEMPPEQMPTILVVSGGFSPQVVTETVYALARRAEGKPRIARLISVVTQDVALRFETELPAALDRLAGDWSLDLHGLRPEVVVPRDPTGRSISDVRSFAEGVAYADAINALIWELTREPGTRLHVSMAGGRKTMSYHAGAALGLWGRAHDDLSHVLVGVADWAAKTDPTLAAEDFEQSPEFWYPARVTTRIRTRGGKVVDAAAATVDLALVPFVPLRDLLPGSRAERPINHAQTVAVFRASVERLPVLKLATATRTVSYGAGVSFRLSPVHFALFRVMAEWARDRVPGAGPQGVGPAHVGWLAREMFLDPAVLGDRNPVARFLEIYDACVGNSDKRQASRRNLKPRPSTAEEREENATYITERVSALREEIADAVADPLLRERLGGKQKRIRGRFGLSLTPSEIVIDD
jgi:CRISPR-associated protein (TIGR02584 family)